MATKGDDVLVDTVQVFRSGQIICPMYTGVSPQEKNFISYLDSVKHRIQATLRMDNTFEVRYVPDDEKINTVKMIWYPELSSAEIERIKKATTSEVQSVLENILFPNLRDKK